VDDEYGDDAEDQIEAEGVKADECVVGPEDTCGAS
jgi:hypothetical protein